MNRRSFAQCCSLAAAAALAGCGGIPLMSIPRLVRLSNELLETEPADLRLALQVDARIVPPSQAIPWLVIQVEPKVPGAFEPVNERLPLQFATAAGATIGLENAPRSRRWLVYSLPPATQAELRNIQATVRRAQARPGYPKGGKLSLAIEQTELALTDPALAHTDWETWMQVKRDEDFFKVWSGTPSQILEQARLAQRSKAAR